MGTLDLFRLDGRRALVTGASRGLGREMALALADAGADLVITGRTAATLERTAADVRIRGRVASALVTDMGDPESCARACERIVSDHGPIDLLINNVGNRETSGPIENESLECLQQILIVYLTSAVVCTRVIGAAMLAHRGGGRIINIASISGLIVNRGVGGRAYETAKAALAHFTRCAAADWAPHGITVNAICPGLFMTDANREWNERRPEVIAEFLKHVPMGRAGEPPEIGPLAIYLASPASSYVTGAMYVIDGGYTIW